MSQNIPYYIAFDIALKPRGRITQNYKSWKADLEKAGYIPFEFSESPITRHNLAQCDILVFACPDFAKISPQEIEAIKPWVTEDGGSLLLLNHAGGDKGRRSNLSEIAEQFGMMFENDQVLDKKTNLSVENLPIINEFPTPHPITEGLTSICFRAGCSLTNTGATNIPVIISNAESEPSQSPLIMAGESGEGRIVAMGSYEMFRDKMTGGYNYESHARLGLNIMNWLRTSRREQLRTKGKLPVPPGFGGPEMVSSAQNENEPVANAPLMGAQPTSSSSMTMSVGPINYQSQVKIKGKDELFKAFQETITAFFTFKEQILQGFDVLRMNLESLMQAVWASEDDVVTVQPSGQSPEMAPKRASMENESEPPDFEIPSIPISPPQAINKAELKPPPQQSKGRVAPTASNLPPLSPLPKKPGVFQNPSFNPGPSLPGTQSENPQQEDQGWQDFATPPNLSIPPLAEEPLNQPTDYSASQPSEEQNEPPAPKGKAIISKSKEELEAELGSLENKLNSFRDLRSFVDKKLESGKINQSNYDKQIKKLESDISKTKYRIDEIHQELAKM
jgi:hypothetical protein